MTVEQSRTVARISGPQTDERMDVQQWNRRTNELSVIELKL